MPRPLFARFGLWRLVWPFALLILVQASLAIFSAYTLSTVRAYVRGESLWTRNAKDAIFSITRYIRTGDPADYQRYEHAVSGPLGDLAARQALERPEPDLAAAYEGFLRGGSDPGDIPGMIWMFRNFRDISYLKWAIEMWRETDAPIQELIKTAARIKQAAAGEPIPEGERGQFFDRVYDINVWLSPRATAFSASLSKGSRVITKQLIGLNIVTALFLIVVMSLHTRRLVRQREMFETALKDEKERAEITLASLGEAVISTDARGQIDYINPAAQALIGRAPGAAIGSTIEQIFGIADQNGNRTFAPLDPGLGKTGGQMRLLIRHDGVSVPVSMQRSPLGTENRDAGAVYVLHDRTAEENFITQLSWQATHDALTGLANRRNFERRLEAVIDYRAEHGTQHSLMFIDLDQFKIINDTCGHAAGDQMLRQTATVLQGELRTSDLLARMGGDEFAILAENCDLDTAARLAERLRQAVQATSFQWEDRVFNVTLSIGVVPVSDAGTTLEEALRIADMACYMAKENGRNRVEVQHADGQELQKRFGEMAWVQKLRLALEQNRFCLYAQELHPLQREESGVRTELLLRLRDEDGQIVLPGQFIPAAERYGLMPMIDRWVVREAFRTIATHLAHPAERPIKSCGINLSGATFSDETFTGYIREQLELYGIPPPSICFEVTETSAITNLASARRFINELRDLGCRFALDDFGSGMSSLVYLKQLPVTSVKIDGSFVKDMLDDHIDRAMVEMMGRVGKLMGLATIAEFVENDAIAAALREIGIDYAQGFGLSVPQPFEARPDGKPAA